LFLRFLLFDIHHCIQIYQSILGKELGQRIKKRRDDRPSPDIT